VRWVYLHHHHHDGAADGLGWMGVVLICHVIFSIDVLFGLRFDRKYNTPTRICSRRA
jgi:hypothetical protein